MYGSWEETVQVDVTLKAWIYRRWWTSSVISIQGSQIRQIWRILRQNCSADSTEFTKGVTSTPEIFVNKHSFVLTLFTTNTIYVNCKRCKP